MNPAVLIVEDELLLREATAEDMIDLGFDTLTASDAAEALGVLCEDRTIDLLLTDISMPGDIDGWELARRARAVRPDLKVIYATGYTMDSPDFTDGVAMLRKPFQLADIRTALAKVGLLD